MRNYLLHIITATVLFSASLTGFSQNEANIWYFGVNAGLDFNGGDPVQLFDGEMTTIEGCATISDEMGNLLFYTDGLNVWNREHNIMPNGFELGTDPMLSMSQAVTIVPSPASNSIYYLFTVNTNIDGGLKYSTLDITLDGGLGDIVDKNIETSITDFNESLIAVSHANNEDFWIITHSVINNNFYALLLNEDGVAESPIVSGAGAEVTNAIGHIKSNQAGDKLLRTCQFQDIEVYDFDNSSGIVSNPKLVYEYDDEEFSTGIFGGEFSPSGDLIYLGKRYTIDFVDHSVVFQYDANADDVEATRDTVLHKIYDEPSGISNFQLGPNEKIYFAQIGTNRIGVISDPNVYGEDCNADADAIILEGAMSGYTFPNFVNSVYLHLNVPFLNIETNIPIYPNPTAGDLFFDDQSFGFSNALLRIYDPLGNVVLSVSNPISPIDVSQLSSGHYFIEFTYNEQSSIQKFIKE